MTRVLLVDDHKLVREGIRRALERAGMEIAGEAADGEEAVRQAMGTKPDVVLMDLSLPLLSGIGATKQIRARVPGTAVLVLTMLTDEMAMHSARSAGANGFVGKDSAMADIVAAVETVAGGGTTWPADSAEAEAATHSPSHSGHGSSAAEVGDPGTLITKREEEVLRTLATGLSISEAAKQLYISQKTLKNHLSSIYQKLDSHDRAQAVLKAIRLGLVRVE